MIASQLSASGELNVRVQRARRAPLSWRLRNTLRAPFVWGWLAYRLAFLFSRITGIPTVVGRLSLRLRTAAGEWIDYGVVSYRMVTTAGVTALATDFKDGTAEVTNFKYHGCGTGVGAEATGDTTLGTESTTVLNPDSTRATGVNTNPSANVYQSVGTLTFDGSAAVTEHGILSQAATGGGTLWDRSVFAAVNVSSGDSIQFTYQGTFPAGG
jgi:hypothetical protein